MKNLNPKGNNVYDLILMLKLLSWVFSFTDWEKGGECESSCVCKWRQEYFLCTLDVFKSRPTNYAKQGK